MDLTQPLGYKINCESAWPFITALNRLLNKQIGIYINGNEYEWPNDYYDLNSCYKLGVFPLFYESKDELKPFASWNTYSLRIGKTVENICSI